MNRWYNVLGIIFEILVLFISIVTILSGDATFEDYLYLLCATVVGVCLFLNRKKNETKSDRE